MAYQGNILSQIMKEVNNYEFEKQVSKYSGDYKTSKFSCFNLLVTMLYTHLKFNLTLRDIVNSFGLMLKSFYHLNMKSIKRSTLSDALRERNHKIFEAYYYSLLSSLNRKQKRKLGKKINIIDSTTISLCIEKFNWAKYKSTKGGIKMHTLIDGDSSIPELVIITTADKHDIKGIKGKIDFKKGEFYVYDRGYACYNYLYNIYLNGAFFLTRIKSNWKYSVIEQKVFDDGDVLFDEIIRIEGTKANEYPKPLRLVTFYHKESGRIFKFMTNNFELSPEIIAEIYKSRWQIELFFKWIKQHLKIKSFLSTSENGVKIQIWCALITYLLINIIKQKYQIKLNLHPMIKLISAGLEKKINLLELLTAKIKTSITFKNNCKQLNLGLNYA
jgi:hypothetical protein